MNLKYPSFTMCIHYRDNDTFEKKYYSNKALALDWFEQFQKDNKRSVTVTFYSGVTPYWVYRKN